VPDAWKEVIIIRLMKPGKDRSHATSYRPIGLTSCLCKTVERMENRLSSGSWRTETLFPGLRAVSAPSIFSLPLGELRITYKIYSCYASSSLSFFSILTRLTTLRGVMVLSEPYTVWISAVVYHCFFLSSSKTDIFLSGLGMFCLRIVPKKMEYHKDLY
jgi:hypothetical protein